MKEIIVIPKEHIEYEQISGAGFDTIRFHLGTDKTLEVPETFEELKELCKKINSKIVNENAMYESQIIIDTDKGYFGFYYYSTGRIDIVFKSAYSTNHTVAKRRTIPQTWAFIKSLIGEE